MGTPNIKSVSPRTIQALKQRVEGEIAVTYAGTGHAELTKVVVIASRLGFENNDTAMSRNLVKLGKLCVLNIIFLLVCLKYIFV